MRLWGFTAVTCLMHLVCVVLVLCIFCFCFSASTPWLPNVKWEVASCPAARLMRKHRISQNGGWGGGQLLFSITILLLTSLFLSNLSSDFDTANNEILIDRLKQLAGLSVSALCGNRSCLFNRTSSVTAALEVLEVCGQKYFNVSVYVAIFVICHYSTVRSKSLLCFILKWHKIKVKFVSYFLSAIPRF